MPRSLAFDTAQLDWVQFSPDPKAPGRALLSAFGRLTCDGVEVPCPIEGWGGVSEDTRVAVERALAALAFEVVARQLEVPPGGGLIGDGTAIREVRDGEQPSWTRPR